MTTYSTESLKLEWQTALDALSAADNAWKDHWENVYLPARRIEDEFLASHGIEWPARKQGGRIDYAEKRGVLLAAHPFFATPDALSDESEALTETFGDVQTALMSMPAPDLAALRWKLDHILEIGHGNTEEGGSTPSWSADYVKQMLADIDQHLPRASAE